jgi:tRNA(fMet)-specific endonuclease VapC
MYMLDTDICIYIIKQKPASVFKRFQGLHPSRLAMSAVTFAELVNGARKSRQRKANLEKLEALGRLIAIQPFDQSAACCYGDIRSHLESLGQVIGSLDMLIAAHALSLQWTLVTNNEREFTRVPGLQVENWVQEPDV